MNQQQHQLVHQGRLIEAGWLVLRDTLPADAALPWLNHMRTAYFAGAQFMFHSMTAAARVSNGEVSLAGVEHELEVFMAENALDNMPIAGRA